MQITMERFRALRIEMARQIIMIQKTKLQITKQSVSQNHDLLAFIERLNDIASYWSACEGQKQQDRPISVEFFSG